MNKNFWLMIVRCLSLFVMSNANHGGLNDGKNYDVAGVRAC